MTRRRRSRYSRPCHERGCSTSAFVVQFRTDADFEEPGSGAVEHVASGCSAHFESIDELMKLFARLPKEVESVRLSQP